MRKLLTYIFLLASFSAFAQSEIVLDFRPACDSLATALKERTGVEGSLELKSVMKRGNALDFYFTETLGDFPWKEEDPRWFRNSLHNIFPEQYHRYKVGEIYSRGVSINNLVTPKVSSDGRPAHSRRRRQHYHDAPAIVTSLDSQDFSRGLEGRHIALWQSHGRYYSHNLDRWTWQRPSLFQTCEDMFTQSFVLPYLVPMLENAGAYVMLPRERDTQVNEVIVDNDSSWIAQPVVGPAGWKEAVRGIGDYTETGEWSDAGTGFADLQETYSGIENPFSLGKARMAECISHSSKSDQATVLWRPQIPSRGEYAVYISYKSFPNSSTSAHYTVHHMGGDSHFAVNQKMGGNTWIYLGTFEFAEGKSGYVTLDNRTPQGWRYSSGSVVSADAVRFGGGMGNVARGEIRDTSGVIISEPSVSGMPRSAEAARYWLQWAGADTCVWHLNDGLNDYRDDFMSRGDWVEWLSRGSWMNPSGEGGKSIPFDISVGFHTDAGVTPDDSLIGTLAIYTLKSERNTKLPSGEDRLTNRDLAAAVQDQLIIDLRHDFDSLWSQRSIWDRGYRESRTPSCPSMLLELLSHQNFADMKYGLDPSFRFSVSRAVYKGILKYLSIRYGREYAVQPLPVDNLGVRFAGERKALLTWRPVSDPHEPTAAAQGYRLYTRIDDGAFDMGRDISGCEKTDEGCVSLELDIEPGHIYSYKVAAYNDGGLGFSSETVSIGRPLYSEDSLAVLVVNNFDRVSGPAYFDTPTYAGFNNDIDSGVPYINDIAFIGQQHNCNRNLPWTDDDNPGFGASYQDYAGYDVAGNTFDFAAVHGKALMQAGHRFYSCSNEAFCVDPAYSDGAWTVDLICGKQVTTSVGSGMRQKFTVFTSEMQEALRRFAEDGGNILVSGSYIGTDLSGGVFHVTKDSLFIDRSVEFAADVLGYRWKASQASRTAMVTAARNTMTDYSELGTIGFHNQINPFCYSVESPDGIVPATESGRTVLRYTDSGISAGVGFEGNGYRTICLGFPIEVLHSEEDIYKIINITLDFFKK